MLNGCWFLLVSVVRVGCFLDIICLVVWLVLDAVCTLGIVATGCLPRRWVGCWIARFV